MQYLDIYFGEFLVNPCPLELTLANCTHSCCYCFANLNRPHRSYNPLQVPRLLADLPNRTTFTADLLRAHYPVVVSNRCDPFSLSNYRHTLPILEALTAHHIPVNLQTRGGVGVADALAILPRSVWYVTIETNDDTLARRLSPGAPPPSERWRLIETLLHRGHAVVLGLNPLVPDWGDPRPILERAARMGVWGVWLELLHLDVRQTQRLTPHARAVLGDPLIQIANRRNHNPHRPALERTADLAATLGLHPYSVGQSRKSAFFDIYRDVYPRTYPVLQDWINTLPDDPDIPLEFEDFADAMLPHLPQGELPIRGYIGATTHDLAAAYHVPRRLTYRQLLSILWNEPRARFALVGNRAFAYLTATTTEGETYQITDDDGLPCLSYGRHDTLTHTLAI